MNQSLNAIHNLYVGNNSNSFAKAVKQIDPTAILIERSNLPDCLNASIASAYTSIADLGMDSWGSKFKQLLDTASNITYIPPTNFDTSDSLTINDHTKLLLENYSITAKRTINGLDLCTDQLTARCLPLVAPRTSNGQQCWIVGCSNTNGIGYVEIGERYGDLISAELNLPVTFLSKNATSIEWAADQILRADIKANDIVFWGITHGSRLTYYSRDKMLHVTPTLYLSDKKLNQQVPIDRLDSFDILYHNIKYIHQVINKCQSVGAQLYLLDVLPNPLLKPFLYKLKNYIAGVDYCGSFIDFGKDGEHAGPKQHAEFAKKCLEMYYKENAHT